MDELKKGLDYLPKIVPLIYILGFITINGYLSNYGFSDFNILNATYLKVGVLFSVLISLIFLAIYYAYDKDNLTDNLSKNWTSLILSCNNILFINIILSEAFFEILKVPNSKNIPCLIIWIIIFIYLGFRVYFSDNRQTKSTKGFLVLFLPQLILLLIINILMFFQNLFSLYLFSFIAFVSAQIIISLGLYGDKNYRGRILSDIFMLIFASFLFGSKLYHKIPLNFGGGQEYKIVLDNNFVSEKENIYKKKDTLIVLFENTERFLLKNSKGKIQFDLKSEMKSYEIIKTEK